MNESRNLKAALYRLPPDVVDGVKLMAGKRGEAASTIARELLRDALERRGVLEPLAPISRLMAQTNRAA